jgi:hypothetical protein
MQQTVYIQLTRYCNHVVLQLCTAVVADTLTQKSIQCFELLYCVVGIATQACAYASSVSTRSHQAARALHTSCRCVPLLSHCCCVLTLQNFVNAAINLLYELVHDPRLANCKCELESALELAELNNYQYRSINDSLYDKITKSLYRQQMRTCVTVKLLLSDGTQR